MGKKRRKTLFTNAEKRQEKKDAQGKTKRQTILFNNISKGEENEQNQEGNRKEEERGKTNDQKQKESKKELEESPALKAKN